MEEPFRIRRAATGDELALATVHVESLRKTLLGILPRDRLNLLQVDERERFWAGQLENEAARRYLFVAEDDERVVGFAAGGAERTGDPVFRGELLGLHVLVGEAAAPLARTVAAELARAGLTTMLAWVPAESPHARLFATLGASPVRLRRVRMAGTSFEEVGFGWLDTRAPPLATPSG
ncbi:MAG TPA: hypothetical protein VM681_10530 [Candidatus Thermoplasmatota archaeon]|nr:hypothetical protein [Candidatus Thermoplasmatota archaeon]